MKIDRQSLLFRLVIPVLLAILTIAAALIFSINIIANHLIDQFVWNAISGHVVETMRIMEVAQSDLITARLLDNPSVVEAKKRLVIEAILLNWQRRDVTGVIMDENRRVLQSTVPAGFSTDMLKDLEAGHFRLGNGKDELHGEMVRYPAWNWNIFIATQMPSRALVRQEVFYLIPLVMVASVLMVAALIIILRSNLLRPLANLVSAIDAGRDLPRAGIAELDHISAALSDALSRVKLRTEELTRELEERNKAEAALQESEERYRMTLLSVGDGVIATDAQGRVVLLNQVAEELTGWTQADARGRNLAEVFCIVNEYTREVVESPVGRVLREGIIVGLANHTVLLNRGGGECPIADAGAPIRDRDGNITGVVLVFRDQTEERAARKALLAEKNKSEAIIAAMGDGISIQDRNFRILYQNEVHKGFIGTHEGELCYRAYESREYICEGCPIDMTFRDGRVHTTKRAVEMPDGLKYFEVTASPLRDAAGEIVAGIEVVRDVTEQHHSEELIRQAQKMEGIGQLAGGVAHDFNNILTAIIGYASILEMKFAQDERLKPYVAGILESAEKASGLTSSLLAFSRKQPVEVKPLDLNGLVCGFRNILNRLIGEDIEIVMKCEAEDLVVNADKGQIEQVLMNMATNARDAMPSGGRIEIRTEQVNFEKGLGDLPQGSYAVIALSDTGSGMDKSTLEHAFEPFFTTKEVGKGTGLGLSIVYGIIQKHGGAVHVYSEPGQGTTFRIYLPMATGAAVAHRDVTVSRDLKGTETILLVEDNEDTRRIAKMILEEFGYTVIEAVDGEEAVAVFRDKRDRIDLVLTDLVMPKMNGREASDKMRQLRPDIKILMMSGYTADIIAQKGILEEGINFISKPLNPPALLEKIRSVLAG